MSSQTSTGVHEFPTPEPVSAFVQVGAGSITVTAEERAIALVSVTPYDNSEASRAAAEATRVSFSGGKLRVEAPDHSGRFFRRNGQIRVDLTLPLDSSVQAQVGSADMRTDGRLSDVDMSSGSGDLYVTETTGAVRARTGSGDVRADVVGGELHASTGSGDVTATTVMGLAVVKAASGDIDIEHASADVRAMTASGDIQVGSAKGGQLALNSASGDVVVGVPVGTKVWLDLNTVSGSTTSDLAATDAPVEGPVLNIVVRTVSGDIRVRRVTS
jgi:DUF4097 and DUF4098 domain-containing protein YvlB